MNASALLDIKNTFDMYMEGYRSALEVLQVLESYGVISGRQFHDFADKANRAIASDVQQIMTTVEMKYGIGSQVMAPERPTNVPQLSAVFKKRNKGN